MRVRLIAVGVGVAVLAAVAADGSLAFAHEVFGAAQETGGGSGGGFPWDAVLGFGIAGAAAVAIVVVLLRDSRPRRRRGPPLLPKGRPAARAFERSG